MSSMKRKQYVEAQLELFESPVAETRRGAQSRLLYLLHGMYKYLVSLE